MHGPRGFGKTLKLRFRVGDLDLPGRRKNYTNCPEEEEEEEEEEEGVDAQMCPCGKAIESRTHIGECDTYKEEQNVLNEEIRETDTSVAWKRVWPTRIERGNDCYPTR